MDPSSTLLTPLFPLPVFVPIGPDHEDKGKTTGYCSRPIQDEKMKDILFMLFMMLSAPETVMHDVLTLWVEMLVVKV